MLEIMASGIGQTQDIATYQALQNAVREETRVLVETKNWVINGKMVESVIFSKTRAIVTNYQIRGIKKDGDHYVVRVRAKISEQALTRELNAHQDGGDIDGALLATQIGEQRSRTTSPEAMERAVGAYFSTHFQDPTYRKTEVPLVVHEVTGGLLHAATVWIRLKIPKGAGRPFKGSSGDIKDQVNLPYTVHYFDAQGVEFATEDGSEGSIGIDSDHWTFPHDCKLSLGEVARIKRIEANWR